MSGLIIDLFAGGGGASVGLEAALGKPVHVALNHSPVAMAVHAANHPETAHFTKDIWRAAPRDVTRGQPVDQLWASPDCTFFSKARGGKPLNRKARVLACAVTRWLRDVQPTKIFLENVQEFQKWGPLLPNGRPDTKREGKSFRAWISKFKKYGYVVEWRVLDASRYGAPTRRKRLFVIARRDGLPIVWPEPTHGPGLKPFRTAADCIDWSIPCRSIFGRKKPLADKTMWRIAQGVLRRVLRNPKPFILKVNHGKWEPRDASIDEPLSTVTASQRGHGLAVPVLARYNGTGHSVSVDGPLPTVTTVDRFGLMIPVLQQSGYGERPGQQARTLDIEEPLGTLVDGQKHALVSVLLSKAYGDPGRKSGGGVVIADDVTRPLATVTTRDHHGLCAVTLCHFRGTSESHPGSAAIDEPMPTVTAGGTHVGLVQALLARYCGNDNNTPLTEREALGIVTIDGIDYQIVDILFRMLEPHELLRAQFGRFADSYDLSAAPTKADKVELIGNSVCPELAEAIVRANNRRRRSGGLAEAA